MDNELEEYYLNGASLRFLSKNFRTSDRKIKHRLSEIGYEYIHADHRGTTRNYNAFADVNEESCAYFYGFILGDGCLTNKNSVTTTVKSIDSDVLVKMQSYLGYTSNLTSATKLNVGEITTFNFSDTDVVKRLKNFGLTQRKSCNETVPDCFKFNRHFWRGLIDADGCLYLKVNGITKTNAQLSLVSSESCARDFKFFCESVINCNVRISSHSISTGVKYATLTGDSARKIIMYLYNNCSVFLDRKCNTATMAYYDFWKLKCRVSRQKPVKESDNTWTMQIYANGKTIRERGFLTEEDAVNARNSFVDHLNLKTKEGNEEWLMWQHQKVFRQSDMN